MDLRSARRDRSWVTEVVRRIQQGEKREEDYKRLFCAYLPGMRTLLLRRGWSTSEVDDILQNAFLRVFQNIGDFHPGASFDSWVLKILANTAKNTVRAKHTNKPLENSESLDGGRERGEGSGLALPEPVDRGASPLDAALAAERRRHLRAALGELPLCERHALVFHVLGFTYEEIANLRRISAKTVKTQVQNARRHLKERLGANLELFVLLAALSLLLP